MQMFSGPASRCVQSPDNRAQQGDTDRKAGKRGVRTSAMKTEVRAAGGELVHLSGRLLCKRLIVRQPRLCDKKSSVPREFPFAELWPTATTQTSKTALLQPSGRPAKAGRPALTCEPSAPPTHRKARWVGQPHSLSGEDSMQRRMRQPPQFFSR